MTVRDSRSSSRTRDTAEGVTGIIRIGFASLIVDPIMGAFIGILILVATWRLLAKVVHLLLEEAPEYIGVYRL